MSSIDAVVAVSVRSTTSYARSGRLGLYRPLVLWARRAAHPLMRAVMPLVEGRRDIVRPAVIPAPAAETAPEGKTKHQKPEQDEPEREESEPPRTIHVERRDRSR